jgi:hypothetical protein
LQRLARHTHERRVLLVGTARAVEAQRQHPLADALSDLRRDEVLERRVVRPLPAEATSALIGATLGGADGAQGSAVTVSADIGKLIYARALHEQGDLAFADGTWRLSAAAPTLP